MSRRTTGAAKNAAKRAQAIAQAVTMTQTPGGVANKFIYEKIIWIHTSYEFIYEFVFMNS